MQQPQQLIIFDGVCNLCHGAVQFVVKRDSHARFMFAPLQSNAAQRYLSQFGLTDTAVDSVILISGNTYYLRSDAAIEIAKQLDAPWPLLRLTRCVPRVIRDGFYHLIAKRRYLLFGTRPICQLPTNAVKKRFIQD
ncbi:DCC1-like thiol-disulfide oxidoreductase family protein [Shewanella sp.]|nr:DCC1-like thiol-disulfide oxidoreductase family protein [Shewanella sp.]